MNFRSKSCLVLDHGLFPHVAVKLAETFGEVRYYSPWDGNGFPLSGRRRVGCGIPNVERVFALWPNVRKSDLIVACDVYSWDEVSEARAIGKPVWGAGAAESLELERLATKRLMEKLGMPVIPYEAIIGIEALRAYLADKEDVWIKSASAVRGPGRGDFETHHFKNFDVDADWLDLIQASLGPWASEAEFIVEPSVPGCEVGLDSFCIDGQYPQTVCFGYEIKDAGYVGRVCDFDDLPDPIREPSLAIAPAMGKLGCRGFYSNEIRIGDDGTPYLIDPTMRCGSPPSEAYIELYENWDEIIWAGAHGKIVEPIPIAKFVAEIILKSEWVTERNLAVSVPEENARFVKLHNYSVVGERTYVTKQEFPEFGAAIGLGDTLKEAQNMALENAGAVDALDLEFRKSVFDEAQECIAAGRKLGVEWT